MTNFLSCVTALREKENLSLICLICLIWIADSYQNIVLKHGMDKAGEEVSDFVYNRVELRRLWPKYG